MTIALLGGTFDPPHIGHLVLGECVRAQFGVERVVYLPAGDPYRKAHRPVTAAAHRLAMVRLATADNPAFAVDDREVARPGPTYTVETLEALRGEGVAWPIVVLGSDAIADMPNWRAPERIAALARVVIARKEDELKLPAFFAEPPEVVDMPRLAVSGTEIRSRVASGKSIRYLVPRSVEEYIKEHGLYR